MKSGAASILRELVAIDSSVGNEEQVVGHVAGYLERIGYMVTVVTEPLPGGHPHHPGLGDAPGGAWGLVAEHRTAPTPPDYLVFSHLDTEPGGFGWETDPYRLSRAGDLLTGLGAADAKSGVAAILAALTRAHEVAGADVLFPDVVFGAAKYGGSRGMIQAISRMRKVGRAIYCHAAESGSGLAELKVASRGILTQRWRISGDAAPPVEENTPISADPRAATNPVDVALSVIGHLNSIDLGGFVHNVSSIHAEGAQYEIPGEALVEVSTWFSSGNPVEVDASLTSAIQSFLSDRYGSRTCFSSEMIGLRASPARNIDDAFIAEMQRRIAVETGCAVTPYAWHTCSDIRLPMLLQGVPTVGFGPLAGNFYGPGEWVSASSLEHTVCALSSILFDDVNQ